MRNNHKRMRGRNNHRKSSNPLTRVYESNGPDVKIRGTASQVAEKYIQLARDAQGSGDPVAAENYYQHAEHYFRLIAAAQEQFRQQNPHYQQQPQQGGQPQSGDDSFDDGEDENVISNGQNEPYMPREAQQQQPQQNYQQRDNQFQPREYQQQQPQQQNNRPQQQQPQFSNQNGAEGEQDFNGLPSFITGGAPQQGGQNYAQQNGGGQNGQYDRGGNDRGGQNRFGRHRRRHRGPRPDSNQQHGQAPVSHEQPDNEPQGE
jgi:hypothetical protein